MKRAAWLMLCVTANSVLGYPLRQNPDLLKPIPRDLLGLFGEDVTSTTSVSLTSQTELVYSADSVSIGGTHKPIAEAELPATTTSTHLGKAIPSKMSTTIPHPSPALQALAPVVIAKETTLTDVVYSTQPVLVPQQAAITTATAITTAAATAGEYVAQGANDTPPAELTEWKVIGVAVISVTLVAIIILAVTFFDSWWGFLSAVFTTKRDGGNETLLPDPDQRDWEFKLANEDGHRYPTMESLDSIAREKNREADRRVICGSQMPSNQ
ncbi:hypothetical protein CVT24_009780 [Panaeolus cyanescens]|uniref:Uncharacterized protein n=1 Tax=Panaeolus cyanescens TaxID=181874 RepID=A0A409VCL6_9AGAR|nr:hypothetical protein CVT24_009780 [Panaeolus cyanescens]